MPIDPKDIVHQRPTPSTTAPVPVGGGPEMETKFGQIMQQPAAGAPTGAQQVGAAPSAADLMQRPVVQGVPTHDTLIQQTTTAAARIGDLSQALQTPGMKLSKADQKLLVTKLGNSNKLIRSAANKVGVDVGLPIKPTKDATVMEKALLFLTDGQTKLNSVRSTLEGMKASGTGLNPADVMSLQVKINTADQEVQFCAASIGKLVDTIKTLMNIQV